MSRLCIIPARGGSKRIPRKNTRLFLGKPIIAYSIEAALASGLFDEVMVSTDDEEIANMARDLGAEVPFLRSPEASSDHAITVVVLQEVHRMYDKQFEEACCVYATAPFLTAEVLKRAYTRFAGHEFETLFPVIAFPSPIQRALVLDDQERLSMLQPRFLKTRSQDLLPAYRDAGMFYWYRPERILAGQQLFVQNSGALVISEMAAHDIDTEDDWQIAEFKFKLMTKGL